MCGKSSVACNGSRFKSVFEFWLNPSLERVDAKSESKSPRMLSEGRWSLVQGLVHLKFDPFKNPLFSVHPEGFEPSTFGSVGRVNSIPVRSKKP